MNKYLLTHKQIWRRQKIINKQYCIKGNMIIIKIKRKSVTFCDIDYVKII